MRRHGLIIVTLIVVGLVVSRNAFAATTPEPEVRAATLQGLRIWVFFADKGPEADARAMAGTLPRRAMSRIALRGSGYNPHDDLPVYHSYRDRLEQAGMQVKQESRWLNAVSGWIHPEDLDRIAALRCVDPLAPVVTFHRPAPPADEAFGSTSSPTAAVTDVFDYGNSRDQIAAIGVQYLHDAGLTGRGVRIGFLDTGYSLGIRAFDCLDVQGTRDFINGDDDVGDNEGGQMRHGTQTLSLCGGFDEGQVVGVAPAAQYVLAKTEIVTAEIQAEEDNWVAGLEWLDSMGCDIVSSSLGYTDWYTGDDLDGNTALSTIAADLAASRGILVVNAAGNEGCEKGADNLIAPADGDSVLTVGASNFEGDRASFSSCGPTADGRIKPDVLAPGVDVWTALPSSGAYQFGDGSSFATPLVSGVCALLLEQDSTLIPDALIELLHATSTQSGAPRPTYGWGLVRAWLAGGLDTASIVPNRQFECIRRSEGHVELWPNPAQSVTAITIVGGEPVDGVFQVFTISGALVYEGKVSDGSGEWAGQTSDNKTAAPGVYLVRVAAEGVEEVVKLAWLPTSNH